MKPNIYIYQLCGILLLLCGYLFSNKPDSLSEMHFNLKSETVFSKAPKTVRHELHAPAKICSKNDPRHRTNIVKHFSFEVVVPQKISFSYHPLMPVVHTGTITEAYSYLYYTEINPPPPKTNLAGIANLS